MALFISCLLNIYYTLLCKTSILSGAATLDHSEHKGGKLAGGTQGKLLFHTGGNVDTVLSLVTSVPLACDTSLKMETTCYRK